MDISFHYPPELLQLLVEAIPRLCRSKPDVLLFFRGAGIGQDCIADLRRKLSADPRSLNKFEITRTVLVRLNEKGEPAIRDRREVLRRVVEFEDFSVCWPEDQLKASGLVAQIRKVVNVKDSFTRMKQQAEVEREKRISDRSAEEAARRKTRDELEVVRRELGALFGETDTWLRGKRLEAVMTKLCAAAGIQIREPFTVRGSETARVVEQIDGAIELDSHRYLVEIKWHATPLGRPEIAPFLVSLYSRADVRGLCISASGFGEAAITDSRQALGQRVVVLCELEEIVRVLEADKTLAVLLKRKVLAAELDKRPFVKISSWP